MRAQVACALDFNHSHLSTHPPPSPSPGAQSPATGEAGSASVGPASPASGPSCLVSERGVPVLREPDSPWRVGCGPLFPRITLFTHVLPHSLASRHSLRHVKMKAKIVWLFSGFVLLTRLRCRAVLVAAPWLGSSCSAVWCLTPRVPAPRRLMESSPSRPPPRPCEPRAPIPAPPLAAPCPPLLGPQPRSAKH
jgi:hypothetical protein